MSEDKQILPLRKRILLYALVENLAYWFIGSFVWIPWYFSEPIGIVTMLVSVPVITALATIYCLKRTPTTMWKKEIWLLIATFIITCAIIDLLFWVTWRGNPILEWYLPISRVGIGNFIGYLEMIISSVIALVIALRFTRLQKSSFFNRLDERSLAVLGALFFALNLYFAITYW